MHRIDFYLDFVSPYAWLAFQHLPETLQGLSVEIRHHPVLLGAVLKHHGQLGPAEVPAKRDWTYRHVLWLGQHMGTPLRMPASHPFNPLPLLRLSLACAAQGQPNRWQCEQLFRHVWDDGQDALDPARLAALTERLAPSLDPKGEEVKRALQETTSAAVAAGVFGVPAFMAHGPAGRELFWGLDSLPMLRAWLHADPYLHSPAAHPVVPWGLAPAKSKPAG